jgi:hypothetical protein
MPPSGTVVSGLGTLLKRGNGDGPPETFTTIPKIRMLKGPSQSIAMLPTTALDTTGGYETQIPGLKKGGTVTIELDFMPDDTTHQKVLGDFVNKTRRNYELHWPDGVTIWTFAGYLSSPGDPNAAPEAVLTAGAVITVDGPVTMVIA